jgi:DNA-binding phage protein
MKKAHVIEVFGGVMSLARQLGISRQAIYYWPETLTPPMQNRVIALAWKTGKLDQFKMPK